MSIFEVTKHMHRIAGFSPDASVGIYASLQFVMYPCTDHEEWTTSTAAFAMVKQNILG
jgi:hypothetical protein